ncbi:Small RNA 2'-O-methyltransferase [Chytriomyces hyalinus]|nr:Small RNA 2'-O-methyltransferase [Chytriomyces hyalinus]
MLQSTEDGNEFEPALWRQRRSFILSTLRDIGSSITSLADIGCGHGAVLACLAGATQGIRRIAGVDLDAACLKEAAILCAPRSHDSLLENLTCLELYQGNALEFDQRLSGYDAFICSEVIEHLDSPLLSCFPQTIFGEYQPKYVVITTPNAEFNIHFPQLNYGTPNATLRNSDHRFEWTRSEFQKWCHEISNRYGYSVEFSGVGTLARKLDSGVGFATQAATFMKLMESGSPVAAQQEQRDHPLQLIASIEYPYFQEPAYSFERVAEEIAKLLPEMVYNQLCLQAMSQVTRQMTDLQFDTLLLKAWPKRESYSLEVDALWDILRIRHVCKTRDYLLACLRSNPCFRVFSDGQGKEMVGILDEIPVDAGDVDVGDVEMGGAASAEAKRKQSMQNPDILKTSDVRKPRTAKTALKTSETFKKCDRHPPNLYDAEITKRRVFDVLTGSKTSLSHSDAQVYPLPLEQIEMCANLALKCHGRQESISRVSSFLTGPGRKDAGIDTMVVVGPSGSGASILIAKAVVTSTKKLDDANYTIIYRRIRPSSVTALQLVASITVQLNLLKPCNLDEISTAIQDIIAYGTEDAPLIVVLDGLNHLTEDPTDTSMEWLLPSLQSSVNPFSRFLLSTAPFPKSPVDLAICRSFPLAAFVELTPLHVEEANQFLQSQIQEQHKSSLEVPSELQEKLNAAFEFSNSNLISFPGGVTHLYIHCLVSGILIPHLTARHESLPEPIPCSMPEAMEQVLKMVESCHLQMDPPPAKTNPPIIIRPTKIQLETQKQFLIQILALITLADVSEGITSDDMQQILNQLDASSNLQQPPGKQAALPTVSRLLDHVLVTVPGLASHLVKDAKGRWTWSHGLAKMVAEFRYANIRRPSDLFGAIDLDNETKLLAGALADWVQAKRRTTGDAMLKNNTSLTRIDGNESKAAWTQELARYLSLAHRKNELLSHLTDLKFLISMIKDSGSVSGLVCLMHSYRRYALVDREIFLVRERVEELDAILVILEQHRKLFELGIHEKCLDIVLKQILCGMSGSDWGVLEAVVDGFQTRLKRKEAEMGTRVRSKSLVSKKESFVDRGKSAATSRFSMVSLYSRYYLFRPARDMKVDAIGQERYSLIQPGKAGVHHFVTSADGKYAVAIVGGNQIRAYEASPFHEIWATVIFDQITSLAISPSGKTIAVAYRDEIGIYKTVTGTRSLSITALMAPQLETQATDSSTGIGVVVTHLVFANETSLLISTQFGQLYLWKLSHSWGSAEEFKAPDSSAPSQGRTATEKFIVSRDEYTCSWWTSKNGSNATSNGQSHESISAMAKLSIFNLSLETPSNALSHRVHLELPVLTANIHYISQATQIVAVETDTIYCIDTKTGDLSWTQTTLSAGITDDWVDLCIFTDSEGLEAIIAVSVDGWAVDVTGGKFVRWRMDLGLKEGEVVTGAKAMNGHLPNQKSGHARNQFAVGQHILFSTSKGGLHAMPIHDWPRNLDNIELNQVLGKIVCVACDAESDQSVAVDADFVIHSPSLQQVRISSDADTIVGASILNQRIVIVSQDNVFSFPPDSVSPDSDDSDFLDRCALMSTPQTYTHSAKIVAFCMIDESLVVLDSKYVLTLITFDEASVPSVKSSIQTEPSATAPVLLSRRYLGNPEIISITGTGQISKHRFNSQDSTNPTSVLCKSAFESSGYCVNVPGVRSPKARCAAISPDGTLLAVGDSLGGLLVVSMDSASADISGIRVRGSYTCAVVGLKWINSSDAISLGQDGVIVVWKVDMQAGSVLSVGVLDTGNFGANCLDMVEVADADSDNGKYRICVGGCDGRMHEYFFDAMIGT